MINLSSLNPQQRLAVESVRGPLLILAGAGTGKTRVITFRIAQLISRGVPPENILAVTFTNKAAREMLERVRKLLPRRGSDDEEQRKSTICTFHSLCVRILRQHIEKLGYKRNFVIYSESDQLGAVKKILSHMRTKDSIAAKDVLSLISRVKNSGGASIADPGERSLALHLLEQYQHALHACNAVDFDDLINLTLRLFRDHPESLEACRQKYRYVMVDEYQDTNAAQFELVKSLTVESRNLCVVGDDDQSIYGWRGAEIANLLNLEQHFPEVKVVKLEQNYRSNNTILQAANAVIKNNTNRRGKQLWSDKGAGGKISLYSYPDETAEAKGVVEQIEFARLGRRVPWGQQAILFRTNIQSRVIETALRQSKVRYHIIGGQSYFDRREVKDFLAYLNVLANPEDDISLLRIANVPARGLSTETMERLLGASHERRQSVYATMKNPVAQMQFSAKARESIAGFLHLIDETRKQLIAAELVNLSAWANQFLTRIGYWEELKRSEKQPEAAEARINNLNELISSLSDQGGKKEKPLEQLIHFLQEITLDSERLEEKEDAGDAVTLITMHSCKGLEFPHVYIVGLEEDLLPHTRSKVEGTLDEERRLFYVAITRAMHSLTISHCEGRRKFGAITPAHPSRFLKELPPDLVEHGNEKARAPVTVDTGRSYFDTIRAAIG